MQQLLASMEQRQIQTKQTSLIIQTGRAASKNLTLSAVQVCISAHWYLFSSTTISGIPVHSHVNARLCHHVTFATSSLWPKLIHHSCPFYPFYHFSRLESFNHGPLAASLRAPITTLPAVHPNLQSQKYPRAEAKSPRIGMRMHLLRLTLSLSNSMNKTSREVREIRSESRHTMREEKERIVP